MATEFTAPELAQIDELATEASQAGTNYVAVYNYIADIIRGKIAEAPTPEDEQDLSRSLLWFEGAAQANGGTGVYSTLIREYTNQQALLRLGHGVTAEEMQAASNAVASAVVEDIRGSGRVPTIDEIAIKDATAVGEVVFSGIDEDSAYTRNSAWSGTLLFSMLGSDQTGRLLADGSTVSTLDDFRNLLFAIDSMGSALRSAWNQGKSESIELFHSFYSEAAGSGSLTADLGIAFDTLTSTSNFESAAFSFFKKSNIIGSAWQIAEYGTSGFLDFIRSTIMGGPVNETASDSFASESYSFFNGLTQSVLNSNASFESPSSLLAKALSDYNGDEAYYRNALDSLSPVVITGIDLSGRDVDLWRPGATTGLTADYLRAKSQMLEASLVYRAQSVLPGTAITDQSLDEAIYLDLSVSPTALFTVNNAGDHDTKIVDFGSSAADLLEGGAADDSLFGAAGADLLIGGDGRDTLQGGQGFDTYLFSASDTGIDSVLDTDGSGQIQVNRAGGLYTVAGGLRISDSSWLSEDGAALFSLSANAEGYKDLTVTVDKTTLIIKDFNDGDLGINLQSDHLQWSMSATPVVVPSTAGDYYATGSSEIDVYGAHTVYAAGHAVSITAHDQAITVFPGTLAGWDPSTTPMFVTGAEGDDLINGTKGADVLLSGDGSNIVYGGEGDDLITGGVSNDVLIGGLGKDRIDGGGGSDIIFGAENFMAYPGMAVSASYDAVSHTVNVQVSGAFLDSGYAAGGATILPEQDASADVLSGGDGADILVGGSGNDTLYGGSGDDVLSGADGVNTLYGEGGNDVLTNVTGTLGSYLDGGSGMDWLYGGGAGDTMIGGDGNDTIYGYAGSDLIDGGANNDYLYGGDGADIVVGGYGNDVLYGEAGADVLRGGAGDDTLYGGDGDDMLVGGSGNDILVGGAGRNEVTLSSGSGSDTISLAQNGGTYVIDVGDGIQESDLDIHAYGTSLVVGFKDTRGDQITIKNYFTSFEGPVGVLQAVNVSFSDGSALYGEDIAALLGNVNASGLGQGGVINGTSNSDVLTGGAYDDDIEGGAGADILDGGPGNDILRGGSGYDIYKFGRWSGSDLIAYDADGGELQLGDDIRLADIHVNRHNDDMWLVVNDTGSQVLLLNYFNQATPQPDITLTDGQVLSRDQLRDINLLGSQYDDSIVGTMGVSETLNGYGGSDTIFGGKDASDTIYGGSGKDFIYGSNAGSVLNGGSGDDTIMGGAGIDVIDGGDGNDLVMVAGGVEAGGDQVWGGAGDDVLYGTSGAHLDGGDGNDSIYGTMGGGAILDGGAGDDLIGSSGTGNVVYGGQGNDSISLSDGTNEVFYYLGDGIDSITAAQASSGELHTLVLHGVSTSDVTLADYYGSLLIDIAGAGGSVCVNQYFSSSDYGYHGLDQVVFDDGTTWNQSELDSAGGAFALASPDGLQMGSTAMAGDESALPFRALNAFEIKFPLGNRDIGTPDPFSHMYG